MRLKHILVILALCMSVMCAAATAQITMVSERVQPDGWMKGGWGSVKFTFSNEGDVPGKIVQWSVHWEVNGEPFGEVATDEDAVDLPPGEETVVRKIGWLSPDLVDQAKTGNSIWTGSFTVETGDERTIMPFRVEVPEAMLPEKLVEVRGKHMGYSLTESHYNMVEDKKRLVRMLDETYEAMQDLTGYTPFDGEMIMIVESPPHPWWAYAGNPIVMDTTYVEGVIKEVNKGLLPFGWIHELGHNFDDKYRGWFTWNAGTLEVQANWKLAYAYEMMPDRTWKADWPEDPNSVYPPPANVMPLDGKQCMTSRFLFSGDRYLADPTHPWEDVNLHSFYHRLMVAYGWEPFKKMYRTYKRLDDLGFEQPTTPEEKVNLNAAILSHHIGVDLVPVFERWRMPVTSGSIERMTKRYLIANESVKKPASDDEAAALITLTVTNDQEKGWMRKGWGMIRYTFRNDGELPAKVVGWRAQWMTGDTPYDPEGEDDGIAHDEDVSYLLPGEETVVRKLGYLRPEVIDAAKPDDPAWKGTFTVKSAGYEFDMPWEIVVPEAVIEEKLVRVEGRHMAYEITETHYKQLGDDNERLLRWLDQCYEAMQDLTGYTPYGGKIITIVESPNHPWYAYAGNPIIMGTKHMDDLIEIVRKQTMPFGWIHELGHDFDIAEDLYCDWYSLSLEAQANIKVVYAYEAIPDQDWTSPWRDDKHGAYRTPVKDMPLSGKDCMARQFLFNNDDYLADPTMTWDERFCQHGFIQRLAQVYGWDPVKKWYRTCKILDEKGFEKPETDEERVRLMAAILNEAVGTDLVPVFQMWRAPVTQEDVEAMKEKYPIEEIVRNITLPKPERGALK